jgi:hypothetical protein
MNLVKELKLTSQTREDLIANTQGNMAELSGRLLNNQIQLTPEEHKVLTAQLAIFKAAIIAHEALL